MPKTLLHPPVPNAGTTYADINPPQLPTHYDDINPPTIGSCAENIYMALDTCKSTYSSGYVIYYRAYSYLTIDGFKYLSSTYTDFSIGDPCVSFDVNIRLQSLPTGATGVRIYQLVNCSGGWNDCTLYNYVDLETLEIGLEYYDNTSPIFGYCGGTTYLPPHTCPDILQLPTDAGGRLSFTEVYDASGGYYSGDTIYYRIYSIRTIGGTDYYSSTYVEKSVAIMGCSSQSVQIDLTAFETNANKIIIFQYTSSDCPPDFIRYRIYDSIGTYYDQTTSCGWTYCPSAEPPSPMLPVTLGVDTIGDNTIYPDTSDGELKWKDLSGNIKTITTT